MLPRQSVACLNVRERVERVVEVGRRLVRKLIVLHSGCIGAGAHASVCAYVQCARKHACALASACAHAQARVWHGKQCVGAEWRHTTAKLCGGQSSRTSAHGSSDTCEWGLSGNEPKWWQRREQLSRGRRKVAVRLM